jgi:hypothetical protein
MTRRILLLCLLMLCLWACSEGSFQAPLETPSPTSTQTKIPPSPTTTTFSTHSPTLTPESANDNPIDGWAVLADKNDYSDVDMTDLPLDYINLERIRQVLIDAGWREDHILELLEFDQTSLREALKWLAEQADENDLVFAYISSHGLYLYQNVHWEDFILMDWVMIKGAARVLILETCRAGAFTPTLKYDTKPHLLIGAVGNDEDAWAGLEEEGLPIIGSIFTYYFTTAFTDPEADGDGDGAVSIQEAALYAEQHQRAYMHDVVFEVPEFKEMFVEAGLAIEDPTYPHVVIDDTFGSPIILSSITP